MGLKSKLYYWITCDAPDCASRSPSGDYEVLAWSERSDAESQADGEGFVESESEGWLCDAHPTCETCGEVRTVRGLKDQNGDPICPACAMKVIATE